MSTILERLIMLQEQSGMNQKQLQKELGLSNSAFSDWKKGKGRPSVEALVRFSEFFGVSMDWLAFGNVETSGNQMSAANPREAALLLKYRSISNEQKVRLEAYLDGMVDSNAAQEAEAKDVG